MKKEEIEFELENLKKILQKMDTIQSFKIYGKFILSHEKTIGVRQMVLNSTLRLKDHLEKSDG